MVCHCVVGDGESVREVGKSGACPGDDADNEDEKLKQAAAP